MSILFLEIELPNVSMNGGSVVVDSLLKAIIHRSVSQRAALVVFDFSESSSETFSIGLTIGVCIEPDPPAPNLNLRFQAVERNIATLRKSNILLPTWVGSEPLVMLVFVSVRQMFHF